MISSPGVGSGLDVNSIVQQLVAVERLPLNRLESDRSDLESELSAFGRLKGSLSGFQSAISDLKSVNAFSIYKTTSANEDALTATADSGAAPSSSNIQVVNLAEANKQGSTVFADTDTTTIGSPGDTLTLTINGNPFTVDVGGKTLTEVQDAINQAPDNAGVSATIISEDPTRNFLVLTSDDTGVANSIGLAATGSVLANLGMTDINAAEDAVLLVDGTFNITRANNIISDAISGVTLTLKQETSTAVQLDVDRDLDAVTASAQTFVDAFNELQTTLDDLRLNELEADSILRNIESQIRGVLNTPPDPNLSLAFTSLAEVGVSLQKDGTMALDSAQFKSIIANDFTQIEQLFANDNQGFMFRMDSLVTGIVDINGLIDTREDSINDRIDTVDRRISDMEFRLQLTEARFRNEFTALDTLMGQLQGTGAFLSQQLSLLPGSG